MLPPIRHVFFDLDNTLWDFTRNSAAVLGALYEDHELARKGIPNLEAFLDRYHVHNNQAWKDYREGRTDAERLRWERYERTLADFGEPDRPLAVRLADAYLERLADQAILVDGTRALLDALAPRYALHVITNGFDKVQHGKLRRSALSPYFQTVTTADSAGAVKPDPRIFKHALGLAKAAAEESLYVGDHAEVDGSAEDAGLHFAWFNPDKQPNDHGHARELHRLEDLLTWLP